MSDTIDPMFLNFIYAAMGGALTLFFMWMGCKLFNHLVNFSIADELKRGNVAVGQMIMGILIAFPGLVCDQLPQVANLGLPDTVDTSEALLQPVRIPGQVIVDH